MITCLLTEKSMIGNLLKDLTLAREVATMLNNPNNSVLKNYKDLAVECEISWETCESLQPPSADSPTQKTIEDIVQRKPEYTVEELFLNLRDMKRLDVIEVISPYFESKKRMRYNYTPYLVQTYWVSCRKIRDLRGLMRIEV